MFMKWGYEEAFLECWFELLDRMWVLNFHPDYDVEGWGFKADSHV